MICCKGFLQRDAIFVCQNSMKYNTENTKYFVKEKQLLRRSEISIRHSSDTAHL